MQNNKSQPGSVSPGFVKIESKSLEDPASLTLNFSENEITEKAKKLKRREWSDMNNDVMSHTDTDESVPSVLMYAKSDLRDTKKNPRGKIPSTSSGTVTENLTRTFRYIEDLETQTSEEISNKKKAMELKKDDIEWKKCLSSGSSSSGGWNLFEHIEKDWNSSSTLGNISDFNNDKNNGVLSDQIIAACHSGLTRCPGSQKYVYSKLELKGKNLKDISVLQFHRYLQYIDLSWNGLEDVSALGHVRYLKYLNVSHNHLTKLLNFRPPLFLTHVNYSFNNVGYINDLSGFWSLKVLNLSNNSIKKIQGLQNLRYLLELNLSFNSITQIENLCLLNIAVLNLEANDISDYKNDLKSLENLKNLNLGDNKLKYLDFLYKVSSLHYLDLRNNKLSLLMEIEIMKNMKELKVLDITNNDITMYPNYREFVIFIVPSLVLLDSLPISANEKVYIGHHHTTFPYLFHDDGLKKDYFISNDKFFEMVNNNEFLTFATSAGQHFGFSHKELENAIEKGVACLTSMLLSETLMLFPAGIKPCFILTIPESYEVHRQRIFRDFYVQRMSSARVGEGAYELSRVLYTKPQVTPISTLIAQELLEVALMAVAQKTSLSNPSKLPEVISEDFVSSSEKMKMHGISSDTDVEGMMIGSLLSGKEVQISNSSSSSSENMDKFKKKYAV